MEKELMFLSNHLLCVRDFKISNDERTLLDWLIYNQKVLGKYSEYFRHSYKQICEETHVTEYNQRKFFEKCRQHGFLDIKLTTYNNTTYTTFYVDYKKLFYTFVKEFIKPSDFAEKYADLLGNLSLKQDEEKKKSKKQKQKEQANKEESISNVMKALNEVYKIRIDRYNSGILFKNQEPPERKISATKFVPNTEDKRKIYRLLQKVDNDIKTIQCAFIAYIDKKVLDSEDKPNDILSYFLSTNENGDYPVFSKFLSFFQKAYTHE